MKINIDLAGRNLVDSIYKQAILEGVAMTYSDTETIVNGGLVKDMTASDISKYQVSVGKIGDLKCDFIVRDNELNYAYIRRLHDTGKQSDGRQRILEFRTDHLG